MILIAIGGEHRLALAMFIFLLESVSVNLSGLGNFRNLGIGPPLVV